MYLNKTPRSIFLILFVSLTLVAAACSPPPATGGTTTTTVPSGTWSITVKVGVADYMVDKYGATQLRAKVDAQLATANAVYGSRFNQPIQWVVNEYYTYSPSYPTDCSPAQYNTNSYCVASSDNERMVPHPNSDLLLLYSENTSKDDGGYTQYWQAIGIRWTPSMGGAFGPYGADSLIHELGHALGAIDMYGLDVDVNPINGATYRSPAGFMEYPYGASDFDPYTKAIINTTLKERTLARDWHVVGNSTPSAYQVQVKTAGGVPVKNASVALYPVEWFSRQVYAFSAYNGTTNTNGVYSLPSNPFNPSASWLWFWIQRPNYLVKVASGANTGYAWLTLDGAGNVFFSGQSIYVVNVTVG